MRWSEVSHTSGTARVPTTRTSAAAIFDAVVVSSVEGQASAIQTMSSRTAAENHTVTRGAWRNGTSSASEVAPAAGEASEVMTTCAVS